MSFGVWAGFIGLVLLLLALDLGVLNRRPHVVSVREALGWTAGWVVLSLVFNGCVYLAYRDGWFGLTTTAEVPSADRGAVLFFTAYLVEKSLSLDNIFVIAMVFSFFRVPPRLQHRVLFWGVLGALVMRGAMIGAGLALIRQFSWVSYVFGALLIGTAVKMAVSRDEHIDPDKSLVVRLVRRLVPVTQGFREHHFVVREEGRWAATPLLMALLVVESMDLIFAVDSIPAVFGVTTDPFLVFTSNVFAVLGLRALYFALAAVLDRFRYMKPALIVVLAFVGGKMLVAHWLPISPVISLAVIVGVLCTGVLASVVIPDR